MRSKTQIFLDVFEKEWHERFQLPKKSQTPPASTPKDESKEEMTEDTGD